MICAAGAMRRNAGIASVEHDHVRLQPRRLDDRLVSVGVLADDDETGGVVHDQRDECANRFVVVTDEHTGRSGSVRPCLIVHFALGRRRVADQVVDSVRSSSSARWATDSDCTTPS
jgi:hypothetical protein